jgi:hypothetical protein
MCFSPEVSLLTFIVGTIISILNYKLGKDNDKIISLFFGFAVVMQLIEYFLWNHQTCDITNRNLSILGMILNHLQPIVLALIILKIKNISKSQKKIMLIIILFYLFFIIPYSSQFIKEKQCTIKNEDNHLEWQWNNLSNYSIVYSIFIITLVLLSYFAFDKQNERLIASISIVFSFLFTKMYYSSAVGALWCYISILFPMLYYVLRINKIIN